jgi:hypothetical protein
MSPEQISTDPQRHETLWREYFRVEQSEARDELWQAAKELKKTKSAIGINMKFMPP